MRLKVIDGHLQEALDLRHIGGEGKDGHRITLVDPRGRRGRTAVWSGPVQRPVDQGQEVARQSVLTPPRGCHVAQRAQERVRQDIRRYLD